jgi:hypothetical protein
MSLIPKAVELYKDDPIDPEVQNTVYAFDSTTIDLCLSVFGWADFRKTKAGIKLHTLLNLRGSIPVQIDISNAKPHDVSGMDRIEPEQGAIYLWDKAYLDFSRLYRFEQAGAFFVMRSKNNTRVKRCYSKPVDKSTGVQCDQIVVLETKKSAEEYPKPLRRVRYKDPETGKSLVFLTNHFELPAVTIAHLYKARWQVELFFKWIKHREASPWGRTCTLSPSSGKVKMLSGPKYGLRLPPICSLRFIKNAQI